MYKKYQQTDQRLYYQKKNYITSAKSLPINYPQANVKDVYCVFCKQQFQTGCNQGNTKFENS